jgi:aspartate aminotransferase-like enzyme
MRLTGPTPLPPEVRDALAAPMVSHRSDAFRACLREVQLGLHQVFGTNEVSLVLSGSGTTALEVAIVNTVEDGTRVLALSCGYFGRRFAEIARAHGAHVEVLQVPDGDGLDPDSVRGALRAGKFEVVLLTHCETSTGVLNDLPQLAQAIRAGSDALILVDAVSSLGGVACDMDALGLDLVAAASQKALMCPPGLAVLAASQRALARAGRVATRRYGLDLLRIHAAAMEHATPFTPAIPVVRALRAALRLLAARGLAAVFARTAEIASACRAAVSEAGLPLFASPAFASPTVTSVRMPPGVSATGVRRQLEQRNIFVAQGREALKDTMIRIGHMGHCTEDEVVACARALGDLATSLQRC